MINALRVIFPVLMVIGALGSACIEVCTRGLTPTYIQWIGATILYVGLTLRNR